MSALPYVLFGYLLGSVPFAVIVSRLFGLADPRSFGSGNPGATNVLRTGNKLAAALTLIGDAAKGWLAMVLAGIVGAAPEGVAAAGFAAFVGHLYPLFLGFKGGKGVATALGVMIGFSATLAAICAGAWVVTAAVFRYSSLAAIVAAGVAPFAAWRIVGGRPAVGITIMSALLIWRHRENIRKLLMGTEGRIGARKAPPAAAGDTGKEPS